jgi:vacuolar-type H+-ATPase subunit H
MSTARARRQQYQQSGPPAYPVYRPSEYVSLREHLETKLDFETRLRNADDRRYAEVNIEREKALKIKDEADKTALGLDREIRNYKDEKANELREQISSERGLYATHADLIAVTEKLEALVAPLLVFVNAQQGSHQSGTDTRAILTTVISAAAVLLAFVTALIAVLKP